jgi:hypothetical protein
MITPPKANPNRRYHNVGSTVDAAFSVCTEFTVSTGKEVDAREEWLHADAGVGTNGILECKFLPKTSTEPSQ